MSKPAVRITSHKNFIVSSKAWPIQLSNTGPKKYREVTTEDESSEGAPGFIPIKVQPDPVHIPGQLHFLFPNGIRVMCPESVHPEVLKTLLNP